MEVFPEELGPRKHVIGARRIVPVSRHPLKFARRSDVNTETPMCWLKWPVTTDPTRNLRDQNAGSGGYPPDPACR